MLTVMGILVLLIVLVLVFFHLFKKSVLQKNTLQNMKIEKRIQLQKEKKRLARVVSESEVASWVDQKLLVLQSQVRYLTVYDMWEQEEN